MWQGKGCLTRHSIHPLICCSFTKKKGGLEPHRNSTRRYGTNGRNQAKSSCETRGKASLFCWVLVASHPAGRRAPSSSLIPSPAAVIDFRIVFPGTIKVTSLSGRVAQINRIRVASKATWLKLAVSILGDRSDSDGVWTCPILELARREVIGLPLPR